MASPMVTRGKNSKADSAERVSEGAVETGIGGAGWGCKKERRCHGVKSEEAGLHIPS